MFEEKYVHSNNGNDKYILRIRRNEIVTNRSLCPILCRENNICNLDISTMIIANQFGNNQPYMNPVPCAEVWICVTITAHNTTYRRRLRPAATCVEI